jgi:hypothetical protein
VEFWRGLRTDIRCPGDSVISSILAISNESRDFEVVQNFWNGFPNMDMDGHGYRCGNQDSHIRESLYTCACCMERRRWWYTVYFYFVQSLRFIPLLRHGPFLLVRRPKFLLPCRLGVPGMTHCKEKHSLKHSIKQRNIIALSEFVNAMFLNNPSHLS